MKYYAVKVGNNPGLFDNWAECQESIKGFSGAVYKSFNSKEEAEAFLSDRDIWGEQIAADIEQGYLVAFCDGSFDKELNRYSYGVIIIGGDHTETPLCGYGSNPKYIVSNNIIGEIFGVINALDWAVSNGYEKIKIYHDYEGLSKWLSGEWNAGTDASKMYASLYHTKFEGVIDVVFEKVKGHSNNPYNDKADALAKSAFFSCLFDHGEINLSTAQTVLPADYYRKLATQLLRDNIPRLKYSILTDQQKESIRKGISL